MDRAQAELESVVYAVANGMRKSKAKKWGNKVLYKLSLIGIEDVTRLQLLLPEINTRLKAMDLTTFHRITLAGFRSETSTFLERDFRHGQL